MLKISQLSEQTGITPHTLRFYEKHGLINPSDRSGGGYRLYSDEDVRKARFIRTARNSGFSLDDIAALLAIRVDRSSHTCEEVTDITRRKLEEVEQKLRELTSLRKTLKRLLDSCCGGPDAAVHCSILEALDRKAVSLGNSRS